MTFFPMVLVAWFVRAGRVRRTDRRQSRSRFFPLALTPKPTTRRRLGEIPRGSRLQWPSRFDWTAIVLNPATGGGKFEAETANHGVHAFFRWPSRQTRRLATGSLGKTMGNPFILAIPREKAAITPKSATCDPRFGKNIWKPVYHGDFLIKKRCSCQNPRSLTDGLGKFEWEPVYHGDCKTKRDRTDDAIPISETIWISETVRGRPCRRRPERSMTKGPKFLARRSAGLTLIRACLIAPSSSSG